VSSGSVGVAFNVRDEVFDLFENTFLVVGFFIESAVIKLSSELENKSVVIELLCWLLGLLMVLVAGV